MEEQKRFKFATEYGDYIIIVTIDKEAKKKHVKLYDEEPYPNLICRLFDISTTEPISERTIGWYTDFKNVIKSMIFDHEIAEHQLNRLAEADPYLYIDYQAELEKRKPKAKEQHQEQNYESQLIKVNDWVAGSYVITPNGKTVNANSLSNLPQYRHLKK